MLAQANLILSPEGRIYHLNLKPGDLATTIFTVGDPDRVPEVSKYFDSVDFKAQKREIVTHTGRLNGKPISVISTGMSTDNIDIVFNEIDALFNIDFATRKVKSDLTSLRFIRLGTAGGLNKDVPLDGTVATEFAIGLDGLLPFYQMPELDVHEQELLELTKRKFSGVVPAYPYVARGGQDLIKLFSKQMPTGITVTCGGFYAPQDRHLRAPAKVENFIEKLTEVDFNGRKILNFEMETAGMYGLSRVLNHQCLSLSAIIANRITGDFSRDITKAVDNMIRTAVEVVSQEHA